MAVKCPKCHSENTDTARFCSNCATSLTSSKSPPAGTKTMESPTRVVAPGTVFASRYEILGQIGAGGMGEVYRALDKNLDRNVAIKILPADFAEDKERMARFDREAKLLAALNHPNIAAIHGLEESEGRRFLVLELAEGETLQARLNRGALPMDDTLEICRQLAEGLEAAHEKGIVHRDLKPGNIMISPESKVKILDFGLAKVFGGETTGIDIEKSPTITAQMTEPGVIMGTAAYMSPEQARSRPVDKKADIWAFGCVLFECLTGTRAFYGETVSEILAHILKGEPDWRRLPSVTPARVRALLRRCLERDPRQRLHDIADARIEIEIPETSFPEEKRFTQRSSRWLAVAGAAVILFAGILIGRVLIQPPQPTVAPSIVTSTIKLEPGYRLDGITMDLNRPSRTAMAISKDGKFIVYCGVEEDTGPQAKPRLYLRRTDRLEAEPITGTDGGISPFLSPDDRWVGFWADNKLKKVLVEGGVATDLCDTSPLLFGANWGPGNTIVFADGGTGGLSAVSADGGKPELLTDPDPKREEASHRLPAWLPNRKAVLFTAMRHNWDTHPWLCLLRPDTREWRTLLQDAADARYIPTGHLVFMRQGTLMAVRFDLARMEIIGQPVALVADVIQAFSTGGWYHTGAGQFDVSDAGSLIYATGGMIPDPEQTLVWVDLSGVEKPVTDRPFAYFGPRLSPDGRRIAYSTEGLERKIFVYDIGRDTNNPLTNEGRAVYPIWTPDGKRLVFGWHKSLAQNLFWQPFDGSLPMERLTTSEYVQRPGASSRDGRTIAFVEILSNANTDIALLDVPSKTAAPFLNSPFNEYCPEFSPDGRWLAYASDESSRVEVYVRAIPGPGGKQQVSSNGGSEPLWSKDGQKLYYRWEDQVWDVDILPAGGFGKPRLLFKKPGYRMGFPVRAYDLSLDGKRFLMVRVGHVKPSPITEIILVQNWFEEIKRLVPAGKK